jgi:ketosteroid isomerase-like protein
MANESVTEDELAELVDRVADAASALIRGDVRRYMSLLPHGADYTLMAPTGGDVRRGSNPSEEELEALEEFFGGPGEADLEVHATYASGDLAVLVAFERQHGTVGGRPEQDLSLRITLVFRREESEWQLVHRHADPLVREIEMDQLAALLRGAGA